ncbi:MAG TPA: hypothetical protein VFR89_03160, partial [candidate division Zixibacteria bacterium]|nr:hypothetical protein [candidate division Zixibacteria bacterium]
MDWGKKIFLLGLFSLLLFQVTPSFAQNYYHAKSENAAFALSLFGTALPLGSAILLDMDDTREESSLPFWLATGGLVIGPSLGYFYGGVGRHAWKGMAIRSSVALVTIYFVAITQDGITVQGHVSRGNQGLSSADVMFVFLG